MTSLAQKHCKPCQGGQAPLTGMQYRMYLAEVPDWQVVADHHLTRSFSFHDFAAALAFVNQVGELADTEGHHPDIYLSWGKVRIDLWTHKIDGLSEADFVLAAKIDQLNN